mgnify:FL=1
MHTRNKSIRIHKILYEYNKSMIVLILENDTMKKYIKIENAKMYNKSIGSLVVNYIDIRCYTLILYLFSNEIN